uniref:ATP-binding protein n=1 Tax=Thaumasiovibrio occultus TaxID=1891184 RepID=UPI000B353001|nr:sensor histidine kinase [Thaumasiovibrio occultus]
MKPFRQLRLKPRMVLLLGVITLLQTGVLGHFAVRYLDHSLEQQFGQQAMLVAQTIANTPEVIAAVKQRDIDHLNRVSEQLANAAEARFVVIGDQQGIRLAHPDPSRIGGSMSDDDQDDNSAVLVHGQSYVARAEGSVGWSVRGKAPIFARSGEIIGIVSVGYLLDTVESTVANHTVIMSIATGFALLFSATAAVMFATHFKRVIFDLEPEQIARLFQERNVTLETVREGIVSINQAGEITTFNRAAMTTLQLDHTLNYRGMNILDVLPDSGMLEVLQTGIPQYDEEVWLHDHLLIVNRIPLLQDGDVMGVVSSFRLKNEVDLVSKKLTRIRQYADSLRSQSHEYNNKLHTIAGLIQMGASDEALQLIGSETQQQQSLIEVLMNATNDSVLAGCLLGKYSRAKELGLRLEIDPDSQMYDIPNGIPREQLVSILGNLLDNALEATRNATGLNGVVRLSMTDLGKELIFEIEDQGRGLSLDEQDAIFQRGYSTKKAEGHGIGLYLVRQLTEQLDGLLTIDSPVNEQGGSRFTLYLTKSLFSADAESPRYQS